jgi:pimeloyl-ACP methyl ester carboxylesterase/predicted metal-dependent enzyme (double-stranded beta helix superfamily)/glutathione S-transferase
MHIDEWVDRLADAAVAANPREAVAAVMTDLARDGADGLAFDGALCTRLLYRSPSLTVTAHQWPAGMVVPAHDHRIASVIGVLSGAERHAARGEITEVAAGQIVSLQDDVVHALHTPTATVAVHAYLGDLPGTARTSLDPRTGEAFPLDEGMVPRLEAAFNARVPVDDVPRTLAEVVAAVRRETVPPSPRTADGVAYSDSGSSGPAVVFIHGLTYGRRSWNPVVALLPDLRCVTVDLPGHGESSDAAGLETDDAVAAVRGVVEALGLERPVIVGHSAGAIIAVRYASRYEASAVVLVDQPLAVRRFAAMVQPMAAALRGPGFPRIWERFERSMGYRALSTAARSALLQTHRVRQEVVLGAWKLVLDRDPAGLEAEMDGFLHGLGVPVWSVHGTEVGPYAEWLKSRLDAQVETWPGSGHFPHLADPDRFAARLRSFLRGVRPMRLETVAGCRRAPQLAAVLEECGIPYEVVHVPEGSFVARGEDGPGLVDGDHRVTGLVPAIRHACDRAGVARGDHWLDLGYETLRPALLKLRAGPDANAAATARACVAEIAEALVHREYLDDRFGAADTLALAVGLTAHVGVPVPPPVGAWMSRVSARPAVSRAISRLAG